MNRKLLVAGLSVSSFIAGVAFERQRTFITLEKCDEPYVLYASEKLKKVRVNNNYHS